MDYVKLNEEYEAYLREHNLKITVAGRASRLEFAYWLEKNAAQQSVQLTALRRGLAVSIFINAILLAVVAFTISGN